MSKYLGNKKTKQIFRTKAIVDVIFDGKGKEITNSTDYFLTKTTKNPFGYDVVIAQISNNGHQYENTNVVLLPKITTDGITYHFGATSLYFANLNVLCDAEGIKMRVREVSGWATKDVYVKKVIAIKF